MRLLKINYLKNRKNGRIFLKNAKTTLSNFLMDGSYRFDYSLNLIYKTSAKNIYTAEKHNVILAFRPKTTFIHNLFYKLFSHELQFKIKSKFSVKCFNGVFCFVNKRLKTFKFLDNDKQYIVTYFLDASVFDDYVGKINLLRENRFPIPNLEINNNSQTIREKFYRRTDYSHEYIFQLLIASNITLPRFSYKKSFTTKEIDEYLDIFRITGNSSLINEAESILTNNYYCCVCHGDLTYLNTLISKNNVVVIDYEKTDYHIFFFDIFYFLYFELIRYNNKALIKNLFDGHFDGFLSSHFKNFNTNYNRKCLKVYIILMLIEYYGKSRSVNYIKLFEEFN